MNEIKNINIKAINLSRKLYGDMLVRLESYGVFVHEASFSNLSNYDIVFPIYMRKDQVRKAYHMANSVLDSIGYDGFTALLLENDHTHYLCLKFWKGL
ncbi:hypothetical protein [uncultured Parabacteroides sp.]|uniref:hypothetical protein n=1 Tax=uncultured Parabacteroides sp. TaxID=512312 RepID=UPI0025D18696|nr:hypothetical protein [uncultured Parabacteroides sp.]